MQTDPSPAHPDLVGGRYRVERAIGRGGMGTVWLCRDEILHREVAVKQVGMLPGESVTDSARALREARSSAALSHRNVVTVFDAVEEDGFIWLVMEHVPSRSLAEILRSDGAMQPSEVAAVGAQVAEGLAAAHAAGTTHRDVKPGNVLVREDGTAKISDFGIARREGDATLTQSGFLTGTPSYFSPEVARGEGSGPAADVWALGATLYQAVEGRPAYEPQQNPIAVLHEIVDGPPEQPRRAGALEPVLERMLERDPTRRISMAEAARQLARVRDGKSATPTKKTPVPVPVPPPTEPVTRHPEASPRTATEPKGRKPGAAAAGLAGAGAAGAAGVAGAGTAEPSAARSAAEPARTEPARSGSGRSGSAGSGPVLSGPPPSARAGETRRRRRGALVAAVVAAILVAGVLGYLSLRPDDSSGGATAGSPPSSDPTSSKSGSSSPSQSPSDKPSETPSNTPSDTASASPSQTSSPSSASAGTGPAAQEAFLRDYFRTAPGGSDRAWNMLGPGEQAQGRASYDKFWQGISSVSVSDVSARSGSNDVQATLRYTRTDGSTSTERQVIHLIRDQGEYLINGDDQA